MVAQIKKFKKQSPFIFEFCFWEDPPHPQKCIWRLKCSKMYMKAKMLENVYEGLNARSKVYLSKEDCR